MELGKGQEIRPVEIAGCVLATSKFLGRIFDFSGLNTSSAHLIGQLRKHAPAARETNDIATGR
jgi:hypothetical protein